MSPINLCKASKQVSELVIHRRRHGSVIDVGLDFITLPSGPTGPTVKESKVIKVDGVQWFIHAPTTYTSFICTHATHADEQC